MHRSSHYNHADLRDAKARSQTRSRNSVRKRRHGTRALAGTRMTLRWRRELIVVSLIVVSLALLTISCRSQSNSVPNENSATELHVSSTPPFQTKEPDRYRAIRNVTVVAANGQTVTTKNLIARDGELRRNESQVASKTIAYLERPEGRFVLLPDEKIYAEVASDTSLPANADDDALERSPEGLL